MDNDTPMKHDLNNKRHMMTRIDILETYGINKHLYQSMVNNGMIPTVKIGKLNYHPMEDVEKAIKELEERKQIKMLKDILFIVGSILIAVLFGIMTMRR